MRGEGFTLDGSFLSLEVMVYFLAFNNPSCEVSVFFLSISDLRVSFVFLYLFHFTWLLLHHQGVALGFNNSCGDGPLAAILV